MTSLYSEVRERLNIVIDRNADDTLAGMTHYLQCQSNGGSQYFRPYAIDYLRKHTGQEVPPSPDDFLPFRWDVPFPPPSEPKFAFVDLFAGIGGMRMAFQNADGKCVFSSEWNRFAKQTYEANFGEVPFGDITNIDARDIPHHDVLVAGFPCQPFSIAGVTKKNALGKQHGFLDETQGTLFFEIARIIAEKRPKAFILENVKNLRSHDSGKTFQVIAKTLDELGYSIHHRILDGCHFVPQHRERILIVGFRYDYFQGWEQYQFPTMPKRQLQFKDILIADPDPKYTLTDHLWKYLQDYAIKHRKKGNGFGFGLTDLEGVSRTLSARYYKDGAEILVPQGDKNPRRLTPRECARLQGFPDEFLIPVSDNQAYRQFGNSVVVPLIEAVARTIIEVIEANPYVDLKP